MRVIVGSSKNADRWFPLELRSADMIAIADTLLEKSVVAADEAELAELRRQAFQAREASPEIPARGRFWEAIRRMPVAARNERTPVDMELKDCPVDATRHDLADVVACWEFINLYGQRHRTFPANTPREEVFDSLLRPLASVARSIVIYDQYMLEEISKGHGDGSVWLLEQLVRCHVSRIEVLTLLPSSGNSAKVRTVLETALRSAKPLVDQRDHREFEVVLNARGHDWQARNPRHQDRHIRVIINDSQEAVTPVIELGPGLSAFKNPTLRSAFTINQAPDRTSAMDRELALQHGRAGETITILF